MLYGGFFILFSSYQARFLNFIQIFSMRILFLFTGLFFMAGTCAAQQARVKRYTAPLSAKVVLSDVEDKYNAQVYSLEMPEPDAAPEQARLYEVKQKVKELYPYKTSNTKKRTTTVAQPSITISYIADTNSGIPPDNYSAVSKGNKAVTVMNPTITVHDATTGAFLLRKSLKQFSAAVGLNNVFNDYRYDPKVMYDPDADKFICVMLNGTVAYNYIVIGFSQTNDPTGTWNFYKFYGDYSGDTTWFDYPSISMTTNEFFLTGNKIMFDSSWQAGFRQTLIYQFRKADGYAGVPVTYRIWDSIGYNNKPLRCLHPLKPADVITAPTQYFLSDRNFDITNDTVFLVKVPDTIGASDSLLTVTPIVSSMHYGVPPDARQPDTSKTLATNDGRILGGFVAGNEIQFVSESSNPANGTSSIYHGVISNFNTSPSLTGRMFSIDTLDLGYPNISFTGNVSGNNQSIISFEYSGPRTYPGYGAILFDGSSYSDMLNIKSGDGNISMLTQKEQRWGDYSGSQPDWNAIGAVWVLGIYGRTNHQYGNYMARLASPYHVGVPVTPPSPAFESKLYPNPSFEYTSFDFTVDKEQVFRFVITDMQGRIVDELTDQYCREGRNLIRFNTAPLAPGNYVLKAIGNSGERIAVHTFTRR